MPGKAKGKPFVKKDPRAGRPKGVKNKFTTLKEAFVNAFQSVGGEDYLVKFAKGNDKNKSAFVKSIASMLPRDVHVSGAEGEPLIPPEIKFVGVAPTEEPPK